MSVGAGTSLTQWQAASSFRIGMAEIMDAASQKERKHPKPANPPADEFAIIASDRNTVAPTEAVSKKWRVALQVCCAGLREPKRCAASRAYRIPEEPKKDGEEHYRQLSFTR